jgi:hypothetical protein
MQNIQNKRKRNEDPTGDYLFVNEHQINKAAKHDLTNTLQTLNCTAEQLHPLTLQSIASRFIEENEQTEQTEQTTTLEILQTQLAPHKDTVDIALKAVPMPKTAYRYFSEIWKQIDQTPYLQMAHADKQRHQRQVQQTTQPLRDIILQKKIYLRTKTSNGTYHVSNQVAYLDKGIFTLVDGTCTKADKPEILINYK